MCLIIDLKYGVYITNFTIPGTIGIVLSGIPRFMVRIFVGLSIYIIDHVGRGANVRVFMDLRLENVLSVISLRLT